MNINEFNQISNLNYKDYCNYLIKKYGKVNGNYFCTEECKSKNKKIGRGKEGLFIHHIREDKAILLSHPEIAIKHPFDYQRGENLLYCDYLEHLYLHYLITIESINSKSNLEMGGMGGIITFICPALNDYYSGYKIDPNRGSEFVSFERVKNDVDVYYTIVSKFCNTLKFHIKPLLMKSLNEKYGKWSSKYNEKFANEGENFLK